VGILVLDFGTVRMGNLDGRLTVVGIQMEGFRTVMIGDWEGLDGASLVA